MKQQSIKDVWSVGVQGWDPASVRSLESLLSIGNGRFGQRANFEEQYSGERLQGSYLAGVYYPDKTRVGWWKNGYPEYFAKVLNSTNWIGIDVAVNGASLDLNEALSIEDFHWGIDMRDGILKRSFVVAMQQGQRVGISAERFCSMLQPELGVLRYTLTALTDDLTIELKPFLDGGVTNEDSNWDDAFWKTHDLSSNAQGEAVIHCETEKSGFHAAFGMTSKVGKLKNNALHPLEVTSHGSSNSKAHCTFTTKLERGEEVVLEKYVGIFSSLQVQTKAVVTSAQASSREASVRGFEQLKADHTKAWSKIWSRGDIEIKGDVSSQQAIRFNVFHLNQTYRGDDPRLNIGPKGFTGEKYGGASYWDTEAYCLPFFLAGHESKVSRQLLMYRYNHLERAIENAGKLGFKDGAALYPMVTMNGEECHNEWEITFEEIHRNGAMAYAIWNYVNYTGDREYLLSNGFEVLLAIARFWSQRVQWSSEKEAYVILGVTGPNEYENNVNNNWYTNYLAAWCLRYTLEVAAELKENHPVEWSDLSKRLAFDERASELHWSAISKEMYYPKLSDSNVFLQQDGFMDKEQLTAADLHESERPINQHWSWDRILRSVFIKQADVLQGLYFFWDHFSASEIEENYAFYEPKTLHESSLSPCVHAVLAARLNRKDEAYAHYLRTARLDLDDYNNEVNEGLHITSMAGTWLAVVEGFGGFRVIDGTPCFDGMLPAQWEGLSFRVQFRGRELSVSMDAKSTTVSLLEGLPLDIKIGGERQRLTFAPEA